MIKANITCSSITLNQVLNTLFQGIPMDIAFQHMWLQNYPWLVYSKQENGGPALFLQHLPIMGQILEFLLIVLYD